MFNLRRRGYYGYIPLFNPSSQGSKSSNGSSWLFLWSGKRFIRVLAALVFFALCFVLFAVNTHGLKDVGVTIMIWKIKAGYAKQTQLPPLFSEYHTQELQLPQHNLDLPAPEGRHGKFLWVANHVTGLGWGNALEEYILNAQLAYSAGRIGVFGNYTWHDYNDYAVKDGKLIPARVPMSAFISGPMVGGSFPAGDSAPRFVAREYYDTVCPKPTILKTDEIFADHSASAATILEAWVNKLRSMDDSCIEIDHDSRAIFDFMIFCESKRLLDIWSSLSVSPLLTSFEWSPLVRSAFDANLAVFSPPNPSSPSDLVDHDTGSPIPGLLALHIRRGDFDLHCRILSRQNNGFNGFNDFPEFHDRFIPPGTSGAMSAEEREAFYISRCFPDIDQIVAKVEEVRHSPGVEGLRNVYIMTNGDAVWVGKLKDALRQANTWDHISSGRDLQLDLEQQYAAHVVDMMIGQRAQVLIGNGFSSLTSNIVMLRMARYSDPAINRFW